MGDPLTDSSSLISAASRGKLRLVRLLVEGGAQVNGSNQRGETALLAACRALREEPAGKESVKLLNLLLQNKADPNARDQEGRTALMYSCMRRAGALVASALVAAGADPCIEDGSGASGLVYAINAQHQPTVQVLIDACRAKGRDIIIIATETGADRGPVTRRYLNVPPSPDSSPVSCMSPSDIILKTGSLNSPEGENVFNFRGTTGKHGSGSRRSSFELSQSSPCSGPASRYRVSSEPWLAINNLDSLKRAYEQGMRERNLKEEERGDADVDEEMHLQRKDNVAHRPDARFAGDAHKCWSNDSLTTKPDCGVPESILSPEGSDMKLSPCSSPRFHLRRNTLPSVTVVHPPLHLPPLTKRPDSHLRVPANVLPAGSRPVLFQPRSPCSSPPSPACARAALLPLLPQASSLLPQASSLLPQASSLLPQASSLLPQASSLLPQASSLLPQASSLLPQASSLLPQASSLLPQASSLLPQASSLLPQASSLLPQASSLLPQASSLLPQASSLLPQASFLLPQASSLLPQASSLLAPSGFRSRSLRRHSAQLEQNNLDF